jgi:dihydroxyacetone kinase-like protein
MAVTKEQLIEWLHIAAGVLEQNKAYLTELDAAIGDADHGTNMARGFAAVTEKLRGVADKDLGSIFKVAGMTLMSSVGGASGMLYGNFFLRAAATGAGKEVLEPSALVEVLESGRDGIVQRGRAEIGDKTMIDAWTPALAALHAAIANEEALPVALAKCANAAEEGMRATIPLVARKGRASYLGERSIGHQDPGATSTFYLLSALRDALS